MSKKEMSLIDTLRAIASGTPNLDEINELKSAKDFDRASKQLMNNAIINIQGSQVTVMLDDEMMVKANPETGVVEATMDGSNWTDIASVCPATSAALSELQNHLINTNGLAAAIALHAFKEHMDQ